MKKFLCMILAVMTLTTITCTQAFAANTGDPYAELVTDFDYTDAAIDDLKTADANAFTSGSRGSAESTGIIGSKTNDTSGCYGIIEDHSDCITWSLKDGVLILTGTGYTVSGNVYSGVSPFYGNTYVKTIIVDNNIVDTGSLFRKLPNLKTVIVMNSKTEISVDADNLKNFIVGANMENNPAERPGGVANACIILSDTVSAGQANANVAKTTYCADNDIELRYNKYNKDKVITAWQSYNGYRTMDELVSMAKSAIADADLPDYALAMLPTELGGTATADDIADSIYTPADYLTVSEWAKDYMNVALEKGIIPQKMMNNDFTKSITREEFCALAVRTYETLTGEELTMDKYRDDKVNIYNWEEPFDDLIVGYSDTKYADDVKKAYGLNIINGYGNNKFGPLDSLSREQAAVVLARFAEALGKPMTAVETPFTDTNTAWAADGIAKCYGAGIVTGTSATTYSPKNFYTAEQAVVTLVRMMEYYSK